MPAESTLYCFVCFNRHLRKWMNRPVQFHREHTLFTQNTLGNPVQCQISFQLKATEAWPSNFLAFNSFYYIFFLFLGQTLPPIPPTLRPLSSPHPWPPMCRHGVKLQRSQSEARREGRESEGRRERNLKSFFLAQTGPKTRSLPTS